MGQSIHARRTKNGIRYRVWSSIVDRYVTKELTENGLRKYMLQRAIEAHEKEIANRLKRANERGTSEFYGAPQSFDGPWEEEICDYCNGFHHAFQQGMDGCKECGESEDELWHGPKCKSGGG